MAPLSPELELLLVGAHVRTTPHADVRIHRLLGGPVDWKLLLAHAGQHRVLPLLYAALQRINGAAVPAEELAVLRQAYQQTAWQNLVRTAELQQILALFARQGVQAVPFKGPLLAARVYGDLALRQFSDLDVMVRQRDLATAIELLVAQGYRVVQYDTPVADGQERADCLLIHEHSGIAIELQCAVFRWPFRFPDTFETLWECLEPGQLAGRPVLTFSAEDELLYLCVHGAKHLWQRLIWICDVAELLRARTDLRWDRLRARAQALGGLRMLHLGLLLAHDLLDAPATPLLPEARADRLAAALAAEVCAGYSTACADEQVAASTPFFYLRMRERLRDRLALCIRLSPDPSTSWRAMRSYGLRSMRHLFGL